MSALGLVQERVERGELELSPDQIVRDG